MTDKKTVFKMPGAGGPAAARSADDWVVKGESKSGAGEAMKRFTIDVPESLHRRIKMRCAERGVKMADEIRVLLEKHFAQT